MNKAQCQLSVLEGKKSGKICSVVKVLLIINSMAVRTANASFEKAKCLILTLSSF